MSPPPPLTLCLFPQNSEHASCSCTHLLQSDQRAGRFMREHGTFPVPPLPPPPTHVLPSFTPHTSGHPPPPHTHTHTHGEDSQDHCFSLLTAYTVNNELLQSSSGLLHLYIAAPSTVTITPKPRSIASRSLKFVADFALHLASQRA